MANITFTEGSGLSDSVFGKSQEPIKLFLEKRGEAFEQASMLPELFSMGTSTHWGEKFTTMTGMDGFQPVGENGNYPVDGMQEGYARTLEHMTWKNSFSISREAVEDGKLLSLRKQPAAFAAGYYRTREKFGAAILGAAIQKKLKVSFSGKEFDTFSADGKCVFATDHPSKLGKGTQSNLFADAFSNDALMALEAQMQDFRGDNNEVLAVAPTTILIPNDYKLKRDVFAAIGADKDPATANNGFNYNFGRWNVVIWPYLNQYIAAGTAPWVLLDKAYNDEYGGAIWLDRTKLEVRSELSGNDANVWKGYARFTAGFNDWRFAAVGGVTGGSTLVPERREGTRMTLERVIELADGMKPNAFSTEIKTQWVSECEGMLQTEILLHSSADIIVYDYYEDAKKELLASPPHDKLYWVYLAAMIDFANGEYAKYQNTMQLFNACFGEYSRWYADVYEPAQGLGGEAYCISAYAIAVKHGFEGTEEEWLTSLGGIPGRDGVTGDIVVLDLTTMTEEELLRLDVTQFPVGSLVVVANGETGEIGELLGLG